jgi:hypothetical protein
LLVSAAVAAAELDAGTAPVAVVAAEAAVVSPVVAAEADVEVAGVVGVAGEVVDVAARGYQRLDSPAAAVVV